MVARALWRLRGGSMDAGRILAILRELEAALDQSDLVPAFDSIRQDRWRGN